MAKARFAYLFSLVIGLGTGLVLALSKPPVNAAAEAAVIARGLDVYHAQYCGICHSLTAAGTTGTFGPPHDAVGVIAQARIQDLHYHGKATTAAAYIRESILNPQAYLVPGYALTYHHMPAYTSLSENDLDALVTMLLGQTGTRR